MLTAVSFEWAAAEEEEAEGGDVSPRATDFVRVVTKDEEEQSTDILFIPEGLTEEASLSEEAASEEDDFFFVEGLIDARPKQTSWKRHR